MRMVVQQFCKLHEPKSNKLKGGYSDTANLIFQSGIKDIRVHVVDQNMTKREAIQQVKDFTAEHSHSKVEFYMGMVAEDQQNFRRPSATSKECLSVWRDHE